MMRPPETVADIIIDRLYVLHERLGEGGMGTVYRATQRLSGQDVALKLIYGDTVKRDPSPPTKAASHGTSSSVEASDGLHLRLALEREFEVLASLHHPHIVRVLDYGFEKNRGPYLVMELLPAAKSLVEAGREACYETKMEWMGQLLRALIYLHRRGVIHRDIKPANVLWVDGQVKVVDFGIAHAGAGDGGMAGTLEYMAPELLLGAAPSVETDLYSVGVLGFQLFTGSLPAQRSSTRLPESYSDPLDTRDTHDTHDTHDTCDTRDAIEDQALSTGAAEFLKSRGGSPSSPGVAQAKLLLLDELDAPFKAVLARLLAPDPAARYKDAREVLRDLAAATGLPLVEETAETRESFLQAAALVGRDQEMAVLTEAFRQALQGHGRLWLLGGESGVGKSRLVDELRTLALVRGARVLRGQAIREGVGPCPVLREVLERICLEVPLDDHDLGVLHPILPRLAGLLQRSTSELPVIDSQSMQERVLFTIVKILEAACEDPRHPLVLLLEDLHWAGKETQAVLARLARLAPHRAILVLGTYRDDEAPDLPAAIPNGEVIKVSRLDRANTAALCESMLGEPGRNTELIEFLHRESEGNPFFIVETMRALADEAGDLSAIAQQRLPDQILTGGVHAVLDCRISHVPKWAQPLLELAAVAGRQLDLPMLAQVKSALAMEGRSLDAWLMHCASMSLLEFRDRRWRFVHDKLRECILERLQAGGRLAKLHYEAASAIEGAYPGPSREEHIVRLAYHYLEAVPLVPAEVIYDAALRAAEREMQQLSFDEAAALLERVKKVTESADLGAVARCELFLALGQAHIRSGNWQRGKHACERAVDLARELDDSVLLARAAVTHGSEFSPFGTDLNLIRLLEEALHSLSESDHPLRARALARLAACLQPAPDPDKPVAMAREAVAMARRLGDAQVLRQTLISACSALVAFGPPRERLELDRESVELANRAGDRVQAQRGRLRMVFDHAELGDMAEMDACMVAYEEGAREFRQPQYQWPAMMLRAMRALFSGRFAESEQITDEVQELGERHRDFTAVLTATMHKMCRFYIGERYAELLDVESKLLPTLTRLYARPNYVQPAITTWALSRGGQLEQVRELLREQRISGGLLRSRMFLPFVAEACYRTGDVQFAAELYERLLPLAASFWPVLPICLAFFPPSTQPLGLLAMTLGRWNDAAEHLRDALARSESISLRSHLARLRCEYAMALLGRNGPGDGEHARVLLGQARKLASELGQSGLFSLIDEQDFIAASRGFGLPPPVPASIDGS